MWGWQKNRPCLCLWVATVVMWIGAWVVALPAWCSADELEIDSFDYGSAAEARLAWVAQAGSPPPGVETGGTWGGERLTAFRCDYGAPGRERCYWDHQVTLDLSAYHGFGIRLYCDDPSPVGSITLYFRSGDGWFAGDAGALGRGWNDLTISKGSFVVEGNPTGWDRIDGIRFSPWRGAKRDTKIYADRLWAFVPQVLVVRSTRTEAEYGENVEQYCRPFVQWLGEYGVSAGMVTDTEVEAGALEGSAMAVLAYNPVMSEGEIGRIEYYVLNGGRLFGCYGLDTRVTDLLGVKQIGWNGRDVCGLVFKGSGIAGLPDRVAQGSWNYMRAAASSPSTSIVARWEDCLGRLLKDPAVLDGENGIYLSHVLLEDGGFAKRQMLLGLVLHHIPSLGRTIAGTAIERSGHVGSHTDFDVAYNAIKSAGKRSLHPEEVASELETARTRHTAAEQAFAGEQYARALEPAFSAREALVRAYVLCQLPREPEFRAVWNHSGTGVRPGDWAKSARQLADAGFTAVFPNMLDGGRAHYPSKYLPHSDTFRTYGDQIAGCLAACASKGLQAHIWKVNWNLLSAPADFIAKMRKQHRTQIDAYGKDIDWLCPSDPRNRKLEADSMLEVVSMYPVDGIHFDYIRYPDETTCYCGGCRSRFEAYRGAEVPTWPDDCFTGALRNEYRDWRALQITTLVRRVHGRVKALKPGVKISAAVFGSYPDCRRTVGQDWVDWVRNGYLDFVMPMDYTSDSREFARTVSRQLEQVKGAVPVYPGIGASSPGLSVDQVIVQIRESRSRMTGGFCIFDYDRYLAGEVLDLLGAGITHPTH